MRSIRTHRKHHRKGVWAEYLAILLLICKGYRILHHRYRTVAGEIDIIARKRQTLVLVEVKFRPSQIEAIESITPEKYRVLSRAAEYYQGADMYKLGMDIRLDAIFLSPWCIRHLTNIGR